MITYIYAEFYIKLIKRLPLQSNGDRVFIHNFHTHIVHKITQISIYSPPACEKPRPFAAARREINGFLSMIYFAEYARYAALSSCRHMADEASLGILQSARGERVTLPTLGPSGRQERLNCWAKKRR